MMNSETEAPESPVWQEARKHNWNEIFPQAQAELLRMQLSVLKLIRMPKVSSEIYYAGPEEFVGRSVLGMVGVNEATVALLLASAPHLQEKYMTADVMPVIPVAGSHGYSLLSGEGNHLYTDSFWQMQNGAVRLVKLERPIFVSRIFSMYDTIEDLDLFPRQLDTNRELFEVTEDKWATKEILQQAGLATPVGVALSEDDDIDASLMRAREAISSDSDIVIKGNTGSGGKYVRLFPQELVSEMKEYVKELFTKGQTRVIVEERVRSFGADIKREYRKTAEAAGTDYNVRVLVSLSRSHAVAFDSEIRYGKMGYGPINVSAGAEAVRAEKVLSSSQMAIVNSAASEAVEALCQSLQYESGDLEMLGFAGVDIILDADDKPWIIEVNSGAVGGIGTLTRLDHKPPVSLQVFLQACRDGLRASEWEAARGGRNKPQNLASLNRLKLDRNGERTRLILEIFEGFRRLRLSDLLEVLKGKSGFSSKHEDEYFHRLLSFALEKDGRQAVHRELLEHLFALDPSDFNRANLASTIAKREGRKGAHSAISRLFEGEEYEETIGLKADLAVLHLLAGNKVEFSRLHRELMRGEMEVTSPLTEWAAKNYLAWKKLDEHGRKAESLAYLAKVIPGFTLVIAGHVFRGIQSKLQK